MGICLGGQNARRDPGNGGGLIEEGVTVDAIAPWLRTVGWLAHEVE